MHELKPCPFCGGQAIFRTIGNISNTIGFGCKFQIVCKECGLVYPKKYSILFKMNEDGELTPLLGSEDVISNAIKDWDERGKKQ